MDGLNGNLKGKMHEEQNKHREIFALCPLVYKIELDIALVDDHHATKLYSLPAVPDTETTPESGVHECHRYNNFSMLNDFNSMATLIVATTHSNVLLMSKNGQP